MSENLSFSQEAVGVQKPRSFMVDYTVLQHQEENNAIREEIKQHRVSFEFPEGLNDIDLFDRCRMLFSSEDYETCYVTILSMLEGKPVKVYLLNFDNTTKSLVTEFQVVNKDQNLALIPALNEFPIIVNWLIEYLVAREEKKYPLPLLKDPSVVKAEQQLRKEKQKNKKRRQRLI